MKIPNVKRCVSSLMAAMMVLTSCGSSTPVFADGLGYPPLQSVIDQLEADEIVRPNDYMIPVGEEFNVKVDFTNIDIPDISKVNIYLVDAVDQDGNWFSTDHEDTYRTTYHVEPVSGNPVYQISRSIRVVEPENGACGQHTDSNGRQWGREYFCRGRGRRAVR